jgi:CRP-like cAMP-binding protein
MGLIAAQQSQLFLLPLVEFQNFAAEIPGAWRHFGTLALMNSATAIGAADDLLIRNPLKRCVATLLRLCGLRHSSQDRVLPCEVEVKQEELAYLSNLSRNATGTILRSLAKRGLLELDYKQIRIFNPGALRAFVHDDDEN